MSDNSSISWLAVTKSKLAQYAMGLRRYHRPNKTAVISIRMENASEFPLNLKSLFAFAVTSIFIELVANCSFGKLSTSSAWGLIGRGKSYTHTHTHPCSAEIMAEQVGEQLCGNTQSFLIPYLYVSFDSSSSCGWNCHVLATMVSWGFPYRLCAKPRRRRTAALSSSTQLTAGVDYPATTATNFTLRDHVNF